MMIRATTATTVIAMTVSLVTACSGNSGTSDSGTITDTSTIVDSTTATDAHLDSGTPLDVAMDTSTSDTSQATDTGTPDDASDVDSGPAPMSWSLPAGQCFDFTVPGVNAACSAGDLRALTGARVDLESNGGAGSTGLCQLSGTYANLAAVGTDYSGCAWSNYIEGIVNLANAGIIVRDATGTHHWRLHVTSNALPNLVFQFASVD